VRRKVGETRSRTRDSIVSPETNIYRDGNRARGDVIYRLVDTAAAGLPRELDDNLNISKPRGKAPSPSVASFFFLPSRGRRIRFSGSSPCHSIRPPPRAFRFKGILSAVHRDPDTAL
jgi:hypothetical protein